MSYFKMRIKTLLKLGKIPGVFIKNAHPSNLSKDH